MRKLLVLLAAMIATTGIAFAGGAGETASSGPTPVSFWYLWTGHEAEHIEAMVQLFNESQDAFTVEGLSVPDMQKIIVAISAGEGPDVTDNFSTNTAAYASKGILEPLDSYAKRDGYDLEDFMPAAISSGVYQGQLYSLPISANLMMLFYNKDLFQAAGISEPPKTDVELLNDAIALTAVNADGSIKTLGFPDFPTVYYVEHMSYAMGADFGDPEHGLTPDNVGTRRALEMAVEYRKKFGVENVIAFNSAGGYLTPSDPFVNGNQAMRIDGPWVGNIITNVLGADLNYGVVPIPYPAGHPELAKSGEVSTSTFFVPSNAKNKDGGWAFMSWLLDGPQMSALSTQMGFLPTRFSVLNNTAFDAALDFDAFSELAQSPNLHVFPAFGAQAEYLKLISDAFDKAMFLDATVDEVLTEAQTKAGALK